MVKLQQKQLFISMKIIITESQYRFLVENTQEIDQILDKMGEIGYENLSFEEKQTLNDYSEHLKSGKKDEFKVNLGQNEPEFDDKSGEKWSKKLADGSEFTFKYEYDEVDGDIKMFFGIIYWGGTEWVGCIVVDDDGSLGMLDFVEDTGDYQTYDITDPFGKPEGKEDLYLINELGNLISEVEYFVEETIIPDLLD